jgi:hypothetical protein
MKTLNCCVPRQSVLDGSEDFVVNTRHLYHALQLLGAGAESDRAVKPLMDSTNFWQDRHGKHLVLLGFLYQITEPIAAWAEIRPLIQTLRLAAENHRA